MWRNSKEEWERRKSYLIRSLFVDLPILSPIYESQEPTQSSLDNDIDRPESPLPDLIIEKELPRAQKYHQDETEEFYDKLQREMRRRYERDFLNVQEDSTTSSSMTYEIRNENYTQLDSSIDKDRSLEAEELDTVDDDDEVECDSELSKEETQKTMSTSSDNDNTEELDKVGDEDEVEYYSDISKEEESQRTMSTSSDNDSTDSEVIILNEQKTVEAQVHTNYEEITNQPLHSSIDEERSLEAEELDTVDDDDEVECNSELSKEETQKTMSTSSDNDSTDSEVIILYEQKTVEAQVHTNYEEITNQALPEMIHASEDAIDPSDRSKIFAISSKENEHDIMEKDSETLQDGGIRLTQQESLANPIEANQKSVSLKSPDEYQPTPEMTRRRQTSLPNDALSFHDIPICESHKSSSNENLRMEIERTFSMEKMVASGAENMEVADATFSDSNIVSTMTSTPKSSKRRQSKIINKYKSRLVPYSSSSRGSSAQELNTKRCIALQTSFSDVEPGDLKDIWSNFFVGTPTIYNICSCRNHVCS